ncbi:MAG: tRNA (N(6)-L-threonylcarbamoyladenosine(37)-C(2))-methylthiotransferase [Methanomassiliicoccales archaeon]|nr:MAG: tRNA (N(6)-L-threonylcarbamoyladenosine(37)-C(2))-methylthiotransferase [Methanomassiliicoccales archaeon]
MKFYFESYGCTMNQGEARIMEDVLCENGHTIVSNITDSDALVLVTCTVIETTELRMMRRLVTFSETKKPVVVAGCMASVQKDQILAANPNTIVLAPQDLTDIARIADMLSEDLPKTRKVVQPRKIPQQTVDAIIPISSGCLGSCTYCITRLARGKLMSCPPDFLLESMKKALSDGYKEIRLTSQDSAAYGTDIDFNLPFLLGEMKTLDGKFRVRVGMMNPENVLPILPEIINAYKDQRIYKFLHLPVQSGSESILRKMGRRYTVDDFFMIVDAFRNHFPDITISTDIIVGFPGESEADFKRSVELAKKLRPNVLNITRFSARPQTAAMNMENKIPSRIAKERSRELSKMHADISREINEDLVGKKERILITEYGKNDTMMGRTNTYKPVVLEENLKIGEFVDVEITEARDIYLKGRVL